MTERMLVKWRASFLFGLTDRLRVDWRLRSQGMRLLISVGYAKQSSFAPIWPEQLHPDWQSFRRESARNTDTGYAGKIRCDGVDVVQVHRQWIIDFLSKLECRRRRCRRK